MGQVQAERLLKLEKIRAMGINPYALRFRGAEPIEETQFDAGRVLGKQGKVDPVAGPRRAERVRVPLP